MDDCLVCSIKINLTLRIFSRRKDGYHDIYSVFLKKSAAERLTISYNQAENINDVLDVPCVEIRGENIITKTLEWARRQGADIPPLKMKLEKAYPQGSGIGAGSGDAAALINWIERRSGQKFDSAEISGMGADVAFLSRDCQAAEAEGIGEKLTRISGVPEFIWVLAFPRWTSSTPDAYKALDALREKGLKMSVRENARAEAQGIIVRLKRGERTGLLPNDFLSVALSGHDEYAEAFAVAENMGAAAWGLCGSGSAFFALCRGSDEAEKIANAYKNYNWIQQISRME